MSPEVIIVLLPLVKSRREEVEGYLANHTVKTYKTDKLNEAFQILGMVEHAQVVVTHFKQYVKAKGYLTDKRVIDKVEFVRLYPEAGEEEIIAKKQQIPCEYEIPKGKIKQIDYIELTDTNAKIQMQDPGSLERGLKGTDSLKGTDFFNFGNNIMEEHNDVRLNSFLTLFVRDGASFKQLASLHQKYAGNDKLTYFDWPLVAKMGIAKAVSIDSELVETNSEIAGYRELIYKVKFEKSNRNGFALIHIPEQNYSENLVVSIACMLRANSPFL
jgi:hypothetical protein